MGRWKPVASIILIWDILNWEIQWFRLAKTIFTDEYKKFQKFLKQAREDSGLTQIQVAKALKTPQSYISKVESGDRRMDVIEFWNLAKLYRKPVEFFFRFDEKEHPKSKKKVLKAASSKKKTLR